MDRKETEAVKGTIRVSFGQAIRAAHRVLNPLRIYKQVLLTLDDHAIVRIRFAVLQQVSSAVIDRLTSDRAYSL